MLHFTNCASSWNAPLPGRINSSACCYALRPNRVIILVLNLSPSRLSISGSFVKVKTCNQFKGTAEVDAAFLQEIESWREMLARNIALRNPGLSQRELNFAVQNTI